MYRFKFTRNIKSIWDDCSLGFHLGFTFLCFASILMIPVWLYFYAYSIWNWFNHHYANRVERINRERDYYYSWKLVKYMQENGNLPNEKIWILGAYPEQFIQKRGSTGVRNVSGWPI